MDAVAPEGMEPVAASASALSLSFISRVTYDSSRPNDSSGLLSAHFNVRKIQGDIQMDHK